MRNALLVVALLASPAFAGSVGAIRWDGWVAGHGVGWGEQVGQDLERVLAPTEFHHRLPFYATEPTATSVTLRGADQATMDQEIAYAKAAGLDYWAFDWYEPGSGLDAARQLYLASAHRADVRWCVVLGTDAFDFGRDADWLVERFAEPSYETVLGRPLVYIFPEPRNVPNATDMETLRRKTTAKGLQTPYVVIMEWNAAAAAQRATALSADAISAYATPVTGGGRYADLAATEQRYWDQWQATGQKVVPWVTTGWDPRPFNKTPVSWYPSTAADSFTQSATPAEIRSQLQAALDWSDDHSEAKSVLVYAWNEFAEGGWICPTLQGGLDRLLAIRAALDPSIDLASLTSGDLARHRTYGYSASSSWDSSMSADMAFDGNAGTCWQGAASTAFSDQWLQADLGVNVAFDACVLSEYGDRTSGYRIEVWDGAWRTAYTGTTIGSSRTVTFPRVTGSKVRLAFTQGVYTPIIFELQVLDRVACSASSSWDSTQEAAKAFDSNGGTWWQAAPGSDFASQWLEVDFGVATSFDRCSISEYGDRTRGYVIEYWDGSSWQTAFTGTTIGASAEVTFPRVRGTKARLRFTNGDYTPIVFSWSVRR